MRSRTRVKVRVQKSFNIFKSDLPYFFKYGMKQLININELTLTQLTMISHRAIIKR